MSPSEPVRFSGERPRRTKMLTVRLTEEQDRVLDEVAREILYFHVASSGVPPTGVDLKSNLLAGAKNGAAAGVS